jgi:integral membrane protein
MVTFPSSDLESAVPAYTGRLDRVSRLFFRVTSIVEAVSWVGMIIALVVKYPLDGTPMLVTVWGWVHGIAWIAFCASGLLAAARFRWSWWLIPVGFVMSVLPFLTLVFDAWMERSGRLVRPAPRAPEDRPALPVA